MPTFRVNLSHQVVCLFQICQKWLSVIRVDIAPEYLVKTGVKARHSAYLGQIEVATPNPRREDKMLGLGVLVDSHSDRSRSEIARHHA